MTDAPHTCKRCGRTEPDVTFRLADGGKRRRTCYPCEKELRKERWHAVAPPEIEVDVSDLSTDSPPPPPPVAGRKTVIFGDMHLPFVDRGLLRRALDFARHEGPDRIVQIGDLYDLFSFSRFPRARRIRPREELDQGREMAEWLFEECVKIAPVYLIKGNHDVRVEKYLTERAPEALELIADPLNARFTFPGVSTIWDPRDDLVLDGVCYQHGDQVAGTPGRHMRDMLMSTVFGHTHRGHIYYENTGHGLLWEMNVGYLGNPEHEALRYTPRKVNGWMHAVGVVDRDGSPRLQPL